ncbi:MAG: SPOR domain-containing protein [Deltaproteobacteria bacterium]|nr:SPOR domain-containing protein [Deltaproteobacteria bacterium]
MGKNHNVKKSAFILAALVLCLGLAVSCGSKSSSTSSSSTATGAAGAGGSGTPADPLSLGVVGGQAQAGVAPTDSGTRGDYFSVWVGSFLDEPPAKKAVQAFQKQGFASFSVKKTLVDKALLGGRVIGDYYLVMVGLFGDREDAEALGKLLLAQTQITNYQILPSDNPGEMGQAATQTQQLVQTSEKVTQAAVDKAGQPLTPSSPSVTGQAFKSLVKGRYVGSYRDSLQAQREAERLTAAGWPASVATETASGGMWYRVVLAETADHREYKSDPQVVEEARASAANKEGLVFLVDTSGVKGAWGKKEPETNRRDASACAGYSRAGRLRTCLERLIGYIPDSGILVAVKPISEKPAEGMVARVVRPVKTFFGGDETEYTEAKSAYGPVIYNRPDMMARVRSLTMGANPVPISPAFDALTELAAIPGRKTVILYSEFGQTQDGSQAVSALGRLKGQYGGSLRVFVVYGDTDDRGWQLAETLAKTAGTDRAWSGCKLLFDNAYFESFVKTVFSK